MSVRNAEGVGQSAHQERQSIRGNTRESGGTQGKMDDLISRKAALDVLKALEEPAPTAQHVSAIFDCAVNITFMPNDFKRIFGTDILDMAERGT